MIPIREHKNNVIWKRGEASLARGEEGR